MTSAGKALLAFAMLILTLMVTACERPPVELRALSELDYAVGNSQTHVIPMTGFVEFDERVEVGANTATEHCHEATYEFRFDYDTSVFVEFREGRPGFCSYGAVLTKSFSVKIITDEDFPMGTQLSPVIEFQQRDPHNAVFQIGSDYFNENVSDLRALEIFCRGALCAGSVERRTRQPAS